MAIVNLLALDPEEKVSAVFPISGFEEEFNLVMITKKGIIKKTHVRQNGHAEGDDGPEGYGIGGMTVFPRGKQDEGETS